MLKLAYVGLTASGVAQHAADRIDGVFREADHESGHRADAQAAAQDHEIALLVVAHRGALVMAQRPFVRGFDADGNARQADFPKDL